MKKKIVSVLLSVVLCFCCIPVVASASVSTFLLEFFIGYLLEKGIDAIADSPFTSEYKFELLTAVRDFCVENDIDPASDDFGDFLVFAILDAPDNSNGDFSSAYGENWADFHYEVHKYISPLDYIYHMNWTEIQSWIIEHYNDTSTKFDDNGNVQIPVEDLKEELEKQNQTLTPKNRKMYRYSWRDLSNVQANYSGDYLGRLIGKNGQFFDGSSFSDGVYVQPYVIMGDVVYNETSLMGEYYTPYQYHIYLEQTSGDSFEGSSGETYPNVTYTWQSEARYYLIEDGTPIDTFKSEIVSYSSSLSSAGVYNASYYPYVSLGFDKFGRVNLSVYDKQVAAMSTPSVRKSYGYAPKNFLSTDFINNIYNHFYKSDNTGIDYVYTSFGSYFDTGIFRITNSPTGSSTTTLEKFETYELEDDISDYGLLFSSEPFTTTYLFDTSRLPANSTVTISGDSVYDYSITDNSTGDTTTIYNYVTNDYSYPQGSGGGNNTGSGVGGNIGGNITVGGQVDVGGKVDINVNINGGNGNGNGTSLDMPDMSPVDDYLNSALEESSGIRKFLKEFFGFLPAEILTLLGILIVACIVSRLLGR